MPLLKDASHLIMDRDTSFIAMREFLEQNTDTEVVLLPPKSPNLNAYMERWFRSLKSECLSGMIFFGRQSLENAVGEYVKHYHGERNHHVMLLGRRHAGMSHQVFQDHRRDNLRPPVS
jgi:putative transposase